MVNIRTGSGASFGKVKFFGGRYRFRADYNAFSNETITLYFGDKVISEMAITPTRNSVSAECASISCITESQGSQNLRGRIETHTNEETEKCQSVAAVMLFLLGN